MGELSYSAIDRAYPYQVALPEDICCMHNHTLIMEFCRAHALDYRTRRVTAIWSPIRQEKFRLHCFADPASARGFKDHFGGVMFDPKRDRENARAQGAWHRKDEYERVLESGPLSVPDLLRN
ncbi:hypothetical protein SAZ10_00420 [Mesorhizobium sp. BAC0120]|uniref:hypothetical protein n=1 Tax=Mesorhizobium sp. BAC0120 TaxID=3090670 RepID=UPI00298CBF7F|nr:hypothetical protein [Mesorhizobium sp. BAC0120]MDW6020219.1 hypothetical protein [Mesorhizobium sp. BAC0120]